MRFFHITYIATTSLASICIIKGKSKTTFATVVFYIPLFYIGRGTYIYYAFI